MNARWPGGAAVLVLTLVFHAGAQTPPPAHPQGHVMTQDTTAPGGKERPPTPATREFIDSAIQMHRDMAVTYSGNADVDFARTMIAHHQGAIDMARIELKYGKDAAIRRLAEEIVVAQEKEIALMKSWLDTHP